MNHAIDREYKILVAIGDEAERDEICEALGVYGLAVTCVADGNTAFRAFEDRDYDLAVVDSDLPEVSGFDLQSSLLVSDGVASPPMIMIGAADEEQCERAFGLGAALYIPRPIMMPLMTHGVWSALRNHARDQEMRWLKERLGFEPNYRMAVAY